jgi:hypothetical protein
VNCRTCGYALWNLRERTCPECGSGFLPSEFKFVQNSVRFCCPHCAQDYYGTSEVGHIVPRAFACVRCNVDIDMDEMVLLPTEGVREERTKATVMPWLERGPEVGWFGKRWFKTVLMAMGMPGRLMEAMPKTPRLGAAFGFAYLCYGVQVVLGGGPFLLLMLPAFFVGAGGAGGGAIVATFLGVLAVFAILPILVILGWAALAHAILKMTGHTALGYGRTAEALAYSSATNLIAAIPCVGTYIAPGAWVWWVISATVMVKEGQRVSGKRSTAAVVTPAVAVFAAFIAAMVFVVIPGIRSSIQAAQAAVARAGTLSQIRSQTLLSELLEEARERGHWPHIADLIAEGSVPPAYLMTGGEIATEVAIGGESLDNLPILRGADREASLARMRASIPEGVQAYRTADFVFLYPGLPATDPNGDFWLFVAEDRMPQFTFGQPPPPTGTRFFIVGKADETVVRIVDRDFAGALLEQNALRAAEGLAELPHPDQIDRYWPEP